MTAATTPKTGWDIQITWRGHNIGYTRDISGPEISVETVDLTSRSSTSAIKQKSAGLIDVGDLSFEILVIPGDTSGQKTLYADLLTRTEGQVVMTWPDDTTWTFNAFVSKFSPKEPFNGEITAEVAFTPIAGATFSGYA